MHKLARRFNNRLMQAVACAAAVVAGLSWSGAALAEVTVTPAARGFDVDVTGQASTTEVLDAIANATGVEIKGTPGDAAVGENHLRGASLERAIGVLLPKAGFIVRSDADGKPVAIIFMAAPDAGGAPPDGGPAMGTGAPPVPDGSAPLLPDDSGPDGSAGGVPPDAVSPEGAPQEAPPPDGSDQPAPDAAPPGTQDDGSGG